MKRRLYVCLGLIILVLLGCAKAPVKKLNTTKPFNLTKLTVEKEKRYGEALINLTGKNATALDKRFNLLQQKIDGFSAGKLDMATFVQIKIELDFLEIQKYDESRVTVLKKDFLKAFAKVEGSVEEDTSGLSLNDRLYSVERQVERISNGDEELTLPTYLSLEKRIKVLGQEEYIASKIPPLRLALGQAVIAVLETAIVDYHVPVEREEADIVEEEPEEIRKTVEIPDGPVTPTVLLIDGGFNFEKIWVNVNDTVMFENVREGRYKRALIVGNRKCREIKSGFFDVGESYNWTFTEPGVCWVSDGIFTTQAVKITVT